MVNDIDFISKIYLLFNKNGGIIFAPIIKNDVLFKRLTTSYSRIWPNINEIVTETFITELFVNGKGV
jgi:hypothetical protein